MLEADFTILTAPTAGRLLDRVRAPPSLPPLALVDLGPPPAPHRADEGFALIGDLLAHAPQMQIIVLRSSDEGNARHARTLATNCRQTSRPRLSAQDPAYASTPPAPSPAPAPPTAA
ncbi:MAG: hypothetical protein R3E34_02810 [Rhodocyclaceae bacterium]